jgi:hypothetical protein
MKYYFIVLLAWLLVAGSCRKSNEPVITAKPMPPFSDSILGILIADTIIYQVTIVNKNPDDSWAAYSLKGLKHDSLIDNIFYLIYQEKATAFDHITHEKLTMKQVEDIESQPGFSRNQVSMIQFEESWYLNPTTNEMTKKVISMTPGIAQYTETGEYKGDKALFKVIL